MQPCIDQPALRVSRKRTAGSCERGVTVSTRRATPRVDRLALAGLVLHPTATGATASTRLRAR